MQSDRTREVIFKSSFSKTTFWAAIFGPRTFILSRSSWSDGISPDQVLSGVIGVASLLAASTTPPLKRESVFRWRTLSRLLRRASPGPIVVWLLVFFFFSFSSTSYGKCFEFHEAFRESKFSTIVKQLSTDRCSASIL
jgi:hypothetical protein